MIDRNRWEPKIGEIVRFRSWDDMEQEYGEEYGIINCKFAFIDAMRYLCGTIQKIKAISGSNIYFHNNECGSFDISKDMIEPVPQNTIFANNVKDEICF